ncbi:hypothetical protein TorRG33x02_270530, partial [Trema orientale]
WKVKSVWISYPSAQPAVARQRESIRLAKERFSQLVTFYPILAPSTPPPCLCLPQKRPVP